MKEIRKYTISSDIRRALTWRGFIIGVIGIVIVIGLSSLNSIIEAVRSTTLLQNGFHAQLVMTALKSDWVTLAIPIVCALPFTAAFVDDVKSGVIKQYLHRPGVSSILRESSLPACFREDLYYFSAS